jgi:hypothetical protein
MTTTSDGTTALDRAHQHLLTALVEGDTTTLARLVADGCQIIGPKGFHIAKDEWIDTHSGHVYTQVALETVESSAQQYGDAAVRTELQRSECIYKGEDISGLFRVLELWVRQDDNWQLAAIQYTAVAEGAA